MSNESTNQPKIYEPPASLVAGARVSGMAAYRALVEESERDYEGYWARLAREFLTWKTPFTKVLDASNAPFFKWFEDGTLNVSYNCLDRNVERGLGDKTAIVFEADGGEVTRVSYRELLSLVSRFANALKARGVRKGDRVVIYMPMSVEGVAAMHACARIGATHSVVFGGFSAQSLRDRIEDAGAVMVITADEQQRGGKSLPLKTIVDEALGLGGCATIKNVVVYKRTGGSIPWTSGRDLWLHDELAGKPDTCEPEWVGAEHPLFLLYTSGSTGKPKGVQHSTGGYLMHAALTTACGSRPAPRRTPSHASSRARAITRTGQRPSAARLPKAQCCASMSPATCSSRANGRLARSFAGGASGKPSVSARMSAAGSTAITRRPVACVAASASPIRPRGRAEVGPPSHKQASTAASLEGVCRRRRRVSVIRRIVGS